MELLKQSTAVTIKMGPFLDDTDGKTAETGLTISQADIRLSKNGGNIAQTNNATGATHDELGYYDVPLDTTDTGTLGRLRVAVHESGALPVWADFLIVPANVYDSLVLGTDYLQIDVEQVDGDGTAAANLNSACDNYSATRGLSGTALPDAAADAAGGLPISDAGGLDLDTQIGTDIDAILADTNELQTDDVPGLISGLNDPTAASIADAVWDEASAGHTDAGKAGAQLWTDIDAILADTNELQADDTPGTLTTIEGKIDTIDGIVDNILLDTNELQTDDIPGTLTTIDGKIDTIDGIVDSILVDTGTTLEGHLTDIKGAGWSDENLTTIDSNIDAVLTDTNELQGDTHTAAEVWDATSSTLSLSFEVMLDRIYRFLMNKMTIANATGTMALRNEADNADIATATNWVTDDDTDTERVAVTWS